MHSSVTNQKRVILEYIKIVIVIIIMMIISKKKKKIHDDLHVLAKHKVVFLWFIPIGEIAISSHQSR